MAQQMLAPPVVRGKRYPMSWNAFLEWFPDEGKSEWVNGWGIAYVSNSSLHVRMVVFFGQVLGTWVDLFDLGEVFFENLLMHLETRPAGRMPDIFVIGREDGPRVFEQYFEGPALFVVEFISDDSVTRDLFEKRAEYEAAGVPEYLAIDARPDGTEFVFLRLGANRRYESVAPDKQGRYHSTSLPGFWVDPRWFRQDPLPKPLRIVKQISPEAQRRLAAEAAADS